MCDCKIKQLITKYLANGLLKMLLPDVLVLSLCCELDAKTERFGFRADIQCSLIISVSFSWFLCSRRCAFLLLRDASAWPRKG